MALHNPPDQPSVEQITTKNNFSYTSHDHQPLTGTPFPENNTAIPTTLATLASHPAANPASSPPIPTTLATLATLTTLASHPAANLASSPPIPTTPATLPTPAPPATTNHLDSNHALTPHTPATPTTLTTLATIDHPVANLASSPAIPATPTTLTTLDHPNSNFPLPLTTLKHTTLTRLSP